MARFKNGEAISEARRTPDELRALAELLEGARAAGDLGTWRRAKAVTAYIAGSRGVDLAASLDVARSTVNTWLRWYETMGAERLETGKPPGAAPRLTDVQREELKRTIEAGPQAAGFTSGVWTGPMVGQHILQRYGVRYHNHHVPRLLHQLGFSVQRSKAAGPRRCRSSGRLAR